VGNWDKRPAAAHFWANPLREGIQGSPARSIQQPLDGQAKGLMSAVIDCVPLSGRRLGRPDNRQAWRNRLA